MTDDLCRPATTEFALRVSRQASIAFGDRGAVVHAATPCRGHSHHVFTVCGRLMVDATAHPTATRISCAHCAIALRDCAGAS